MAELAPKRYRFSKEAAEQPYAVSWWSPPSPREVVLFTGIRAALEYRELVRGLRPGAEVRLIGRSALTVEDLIELYLRSRRGELPLATSMRYVRLFRGLTQAIGATRLADLKYFGPREWDDALAGPRQIRALTRAALDWAVRQMLLDANPLR